MYGNRVASLGLLVLRLVVGILFALHGAQKLFTGMLPGFGSSLTRMGVPLPNVAAVLVAFVEFIGDVLLIAGLFTRVAAALIAIDMVFAIFLVHLRRGFFNQGGGFRQLGHTLADGLCDLAKRRTVARKLIPDDLLLLVAPR